MSSFEGRTSFFLFGLPNGKRKVSFGRTAEQAYEALRYRLSPEELACVDRHDFVQCKQEDFRDYLDLLG